MHTHTHTPHTRVLTVFHGALHGYAYVYYTHFRNSTAATAAAAERTKKLRLRIYTYSVLDMNCSIVFLVRSLSIRIRIC